MTSLTQQQQAAVSSNAARILVSAGAGSGKTHVLVERYIACLLRNPNLSVHGLIAVTFTRKAANEMRIRLKKRLRQLLENSHGEQKERWATCLAEIDGAKIGTIHSLCETIIKTFPLDAGVDPELEVLDDLAQAKLLNESIDQVFREVIAGQTAEHELLLEFDMQQIRQWLTTSLRGALQFREAIKDVADLSRPDLIEYAQEVFQRTRTRAILSFARNSVIQQAVGILRTVVPGEMTKTLDEHRLAAIAYAGQILWAVEEKTDAKIETVWQALVELANLKPGNTGGNKEHAKATRAAIKSLRELASSVVEKIPDAFSATDEKAFEFVFRFIALARRAQDIYSDAKREQFTADYNDLIVLALVALEKPGSAAKRFYNGTIAEILVDEFQDTNRVQSSLLAHMVGPQTTMFLIGDDKQSIYKFQGADVSTFNDWKTHMAADSDSVLLSLNKSFRSHPGIVRFVNSLFSELMGERMSGGPFDAAFNPLDAGRGEGEEQAPRVEVVLYSDGMFDASAGRAEQNRRAEAKAVAEWILNKIAEGVPVQEKSGPVRPIRYGDFAVLVQRNKDFAWLERSLVDAKIPYVMLGGRNFLDRQEIYDVENVLSFLASPLNDHALLGALRSPMFAVSDDLIHAMAGSRAGAASLWYALAAAARQKKPGYEPIRRAVALLKKFLHDAGRLQLDELIRRIIDRTGYDIVLLSLPNGRQRSRNLWKLVALAAGRNQLSCGEFAESLRLMREYNVQQTDASLDTHDSVKLMTIHGSKGLEFPAVILPVLDATGGGRSDRVVFHKQYGVALNTARTDTDVKPAYYQVACAINEEMEIAEKKRLFYVATTRARDYIGLFLNPDSRNAPTFRTWLKDWLKIEAPHDGQVTLQHGQSDICALTSIEVSEEPFEDRETGNAETEIEGKLTWDLIWPSLDGEIAAPPPNAGVRITPGQSRSNLEPTVVGTLFHALMENLPGDLAPLEDDLLECLAFAQGDVVADLLLRRELVEQARQLMAKFYESELHAQLRSAKRRITEFPYLFLKDGVQSRRPDLIFEDNQGRWHIVDYKTDRIAEQEVDAHVNQHRAQVREYATELQTLTGVEFSGSVYFAQLGLLCPLDKPSAAPTPLLEQTNFAAPTEPVPPPVAGVSESTPAQDSNFAVPTEHTSNPIADISGNF